MNDHSEGFNIEKEYIQMEKEISKINKKYFYMKNNYKSEIEKIEKCFDIKLNIFNLIENQHLIIKQLTNLIKILFSNKQNILKLDKNINDKNKSPTSINIISPKNNIEFNGTTSHNLYSKNYLNINKFINVKPIKREFNVKRSRNRSLSDIKFKSQLNLKNQIKEFRKIKKFFWKSKSNHSINRNFKTNTLNNSNSFLNNSFEIIIRKGKINKESVRNLNTVGNLVPFSSTKKLFYKSLNIIQKYENKHRRSKSIGNKSINFSNCIM